MLGTSLVLLLLSDKLSCMRMLQLVSCDIRHSLSRYGCQPSDFSKLRTTRMRKQIYMRHGPSFLRLIPEGTTKSLGVNWRRTRLEGRPSKEYRGYWLVLYPGMSLPSSSFRLLGLIDARKVYRVKCRVHSQLSITSQHLLDPRPPKSASHPSPSHQTPPT